MKRNRAMIDVSDLNVVRHGAVRRRAEDNAKIIEEEFKGSNDIVVRRVTAHGRHFVFAYCDGLCDGMMSGQNVLRPIMEYDGDIPVEGAAEFISESVAVNAGSSMEESLDETIRGILLGNLAAFIDDERYSLLFSVQKIPIRSIAEPLSEVQEWGSREGFTESLKINLALVRKRMTTTDFKAEVMEIGKTSNTKIAICYMEQKAEESLVTEVKERLSAVKIDLVLGANYLTEFLNTRQKSLFSMVGDTERPDIFCAKINEGKVGIIIDGTPFSLIVPNFFIENFQTMDDYLNRPYFSTIMRIVRMMCFVFSIFLPGVYVAVGLYHQELLPDDMLFSIVMSESNTMFPLMIEALVIHFIYEIVREAGLRMPKSVGQAVSIVGALVIGDAAVTAGLIGAPMLIVVAITAISSFVTSNLYQPVSVLRLVFIIVGGLSGLYGIIIGMSALIINMCSLEQYGSAYLAPFVPFDRSFFRDTIIRRGFLRNSRYVFNIGKLKKLNKR